MLSSKLTICVDFGAIRDCINSNVIFFIFLLPNALSLYFGVQMEYEVVEEIIYGLESGVLFGYLERAYRFGFTYLAYDIHLSSNICCWFSKYIQTIVLVSLQKHFKRDFKTSFELST